jgi:hypothetical protein
VHRDLALRRLSRLWLVATFISPAEGCIPCMSSEFMVRLTSALWPYPHLPLTRHLFGINTALILASGRESIVLGHRTEYESSTAVFRANVSDGGLGGVRSVVFAYFSYYILGRIPLNFPIQLLIPMHVLYRRIFSSIIRQINILLLFHLTQ